MNYSTNSKSNLVLINGCRRNGNISISKYYPDVSRPIFISILWHILIIEYCNLC